MGFCMDGKKLCPLHPDFRPEKKLKRSNWKEKKEISREKPRDQFDPILPYHLRADVLHEPRNLVRSAPDIAPVNDRY